MNIIDNFKDKYYFLSNYYNCDVYYKGYHFNNTEAAFHSQKDPTRVKEFLTLTPNEAKKLGRKVKLRADWEEIKDNIMYEICLAKFTQNTILKEKLLQTGNAILIEGNTWHDNYWGKYNEQGLNKLGNILMRIRGELQ